MGADFKKGMDVVEVKHMEHKAVRASSIQDEHAFDVDSLVDAYGLDREMMRRGALLAENPDLQSLNFSEEELEALRSEKVHRWRHPLAMYMTIFLCSLGACVQGWDQTGANGANLSFPQEFGIPISNATDPDFEKNNWLVGLVNAGPYLGAVGCSVWLSDPINHYIGRRGAIFLAAIFCIVAPLGSAFTRNWWELLICRLILGLGVGLKEVTAPVLAAENAPKEIRGALVMSWQLWTAFGLFLGNSANLILHKVGKIAWRLQLGSALIPAVPLLLLVYLCPESPRWCIKKNKIREAYGSLCKLRKHEVQAARDLVQIYMQVQEENQQIQKSGNLMRRAVQLFSEPRVRRATLASSVVMIGQQMCGINIISFFSSSIFEEIASITQALWASWGFGLVNFVFAIPALFTIDTFGRRTLLLFTFPQMFWTLLVTGLCYLIHDTQTKLATVALFIYLFTVFYSPGEGPVPFTYSAEVFPLSHRELGMAWGVAVNNLFAAVLSLTFFRMRAAMTTTGAFGFYAGLNLVALVWIFLWVPETKQKSLEELDSVFSIPTRVFMRHQVCEILPYYIQRYVLWRKVPRPQLVCPVSSERCHQRESGPSSRGSSFSQDIKPEIGHINYLEP